MMLKEEEVQEDMIAQSRILHFGTLSLTDEPVRSATRKALEYAEKHGVMVTFDPNLRPPLWNNLQDAKEQIWFGLSKCSAVKMSEEELEFITGERSLDRGVEAVRNRFDIPLICITMGKKGSRAYYGDHVCVEKAGWQRTARSISIANSTVRIISIRIIPRTIRSLSCICRSATMAGWRLRRQQEKRRSVFMRSTWRRMPASWFMTSGRTVLW